MRPDYCPVANEPCQAMCLDGCRLRERSHYVAELEKERKQLQAMLHQERTESEALLRQALEMMEESHYAVANTARRRDGALRSDRGVARAAGRTGMTPAEYRMRCRLSEISLPDAPYRAMLTKLHDDMLAEIEAAHAVGIRQERELMGAEEELSEERALRQRLIDATAKAHTTYQSKLLADEALLRQALKKLEELRVTVDSEWGECRHLDEIDAAGDQWPVVNAIRERLGIKT